MNGSIVYTTYDTRDEKTIVQIFGIMENGQSFVTINTLEPYCFIRESDLSKVKKILGKYVLEKTACSNFKGEPVIKIKAQNQSMLNKLSEALHHKEIDTYEADVKPHTRFLIDNDLFFSVKIEGEYASSERIDRIYHEPSIKPSPAKTNLKVLSLDTESSKNNGQLFCIGISGESYEKSPTLSCSVFLQFTGSFFRGRHHHQSNRYHQNYNQWHNRHL